MTTRASSWRPSLCQPTPPGTTSSTSATLLPSTADPSLSTPMAWPCSAMSPPPMVATPARSFNGPSPPWASPIWSRPAPRPKAKSNAALAPSKSESSPSWPTRKSPITPPHRNYWPASWPAKIAPSAGSPVYPRTTPAPRLRKNSAPYCALVLTPACWTCIWHCTSDDGSMPTIKLISSVAAGPSVPPLGITSPSFTIPIASSGSSPNHPNPRKIVGPKSSESSPSKPVSFCSHIQSHFELPPTQAGKDIAPKGRPVVTSRIGLVGLE